VGVVAVGVVAVGVVATVAGEGLQEEEVGQPQTAQPQQLQQQQQTEQLQEQPDWQSSQWRAAKRNKGLQRPIWWAKRQTEQWRSHWPQRQQWQGGWPAAAATAATNDISSVVRFLCMCHACVCCVCPNDDITLQLDTSCEQVFRRGLCRRPHRPGALGQVVLQEASSFGMCDCLRGCLATCCK
jgi:hypothetical protein